MKIFSLSKYLLKIKTLTFILSLLLIFLITSSLRNEQYSPFLILFWVISIISFIFCFLPKIRFHKENFKIKVSLKNLLIIFLISLPSITRILNFNPSVIHQDEFITAYFSATHDFKKVNFFSGIPQNKGEWVSQFPTPFFIFQKMFFSLFGKNILSIKLSGIPYVFIVSIMLFLIVKKIFNNQVAIISLFLYTFLSISLYLETFGFHFISSTAVFLFFFYLCLLQWRENKSFNAALLGVSCGFNYLFYVTSFIAFPFFMLLFIIQFLKLREVSVLKNLLIGLFGFFIVLGPFFYYAYRFDNYFFSRINQVSLLNGSWSPAKELIKNGKNPLLIIKENFLLSIRSLYKDGVGGHGGYDFGHLAFFERLSFCLFIIGLILALIIMFEKIEVLFILLVIIISFVTGVVLTIPPPAYHRFSLAFPFLSIILSFPFYVLLSFKKINPALKYTFIFFLLTIYSLNNQKYFLKSIAKQKNPEVLQLSELIAKNFTKRNIYIAFFPSFAFEKIFYFTLKEKVLTIKTDFHSNLLDKFNPNEKYLYIIGLPKEFEKDFKSKDKYGELVHFSENYSLFFN